MNKILKINNIDSIPKILILLLWLITLTGLNGCMGSYGRVTRDPELTKAIKNNHFVENYKYYYYGYASKPYVVAGIDPKYEVRSKVWKEFDPKSETEKYKQMIYWIWEDYGYSPYGAHILDPSANKIGVLYSSVRHISVKFTKDNRIVLMPDKPFLWGPDGGASFSRFGGR